MRDAAAMQAALTLSSVALLQVATDFSKARRASDWATARCRGRCFRHHAEGAVEKQGAAGEGQQDRSALRAINVHADRLTVDVQESCRGPQAEYLDAGVLSQVEVAAVHVEDLVQNRIDDDVGGIAIAIGEQRADNGGGIRRRGNGAQVHHTWYLGMVHEPADPLFG